ncbi:MAG: hypothetical protein ABIS50_22510 [Luteolibacter sp.]|uniref:hypothetical protein n=1 Tax=Luteolibacter sp. TaxID=1962973 RepID=UPI0032649FBF
MIAQFEIQALKLGLGKNKTGAEITLADNARPQCLVPFSYYIGDVPAFEAKNGKVLADLKFKLVTIGITSMSASTVGNSIKLEGDFALAFDKGANVPK